MAYGEGSIFQLKNKAGKKIWYVEVVTGHKPNGRPIHRRLKADSLQHARKLRAELNSAKNQGKLSQHHNITVQDFGHYWALNVKPNSVKPSTASWYQWLLRKYVYPYLGRRTIGDLQFRDVVDWINSLLLSGLGTATVNSARAVLGQICKQAVREGILRSNPVDLTDKVRKVFGEKTQVREAWSREEAAEVLIKSEGTAMDLFIHLCLTLGLRHGEALGLKWECVDLESRMIEIKYTLKDERRETSTGKGVVRLKLQDPKTKSSIRKLHISDRLFAAFERHQMLQSLKKMQAGEKWQESGMVFTSNIGTGIYQANFRNYFYRFLEENGIRKIRVHDMRHSFGTLALEAEAPIEAVSQAMGHSDIGITKKIYAPDVRGLNERALSAFENYVAQEIVSELKCSAAEITTQEPLEIVMPIEISKRAYRAQIDYKAKQKSSK